VWAVKGTTRPGRVNELRGATSIPAKEKKWGPKTIAQDVGKKREGAGSQRK